MLWYNAYITLKLVLPASPLQERARAKTDLSGVRIMSSGIVMTYCYHVNYLDKYPCSIPEYAFHLQLNVSQMFWKIPVHQRKRAFNAVSNLYMSY